LASEAEAVLSVLAFNILHAANAFGAAAIMPAPGVETRYRKWQSRP
jgi:hypothetical protein